MNVRRVLTSDCAALDESSACSARNPLLQGCAGRNDGSETVRPAANVRAASQESLA